MGTENVYKREVYEPHHGSNGQKEDELGYDGELFLLFEEGRGGLYGQNTSDGDIDA